MPEKRKNVADEENEDLGQNQREINAQLVITSLDAYEQAEASEARASELRATADLREQLMAILGHDLRNPLSSILMGSGLLLARGNLDADDSKIVERIVSSGNRMTRMIGQVLEFARARLGGGLDLERQSADLGDVCRNVAEELEVGTSVPVRCVVSDEMRGSWDVDRLSQVLSNIGGNAIEHCAPGTIVVFVAYAQGDDVIVEITNTGAPIPDEVMPHLFEPFRRAKSSERARNGNLGLGLYIASEVVKAHGGKLTARSENGETTFTARLPRLPKPTQSAIV